MELKHLRFFYAAAKLQHITAASEELMVSQPFLTKIIKQLESELGVKLFDHTGRNIRLNDYGKAFYQHTESILRELDNAQLELAEMAGYYSNTVHVMTNAALYMPSLLTSVLAANTTINLIQSSGRRFKLIEAVQDGTVDYVICSPMLEFEPGSGLVSEEILTDKGYLIFSPNHPLSSADEIKPEQLDGQDFYTSPQGFTMRDYADAGFAKSGIKPNIVVETTDTSTIIDYVNAGNGFALLPMAFAAQDPSLLKRCKALPGEGGCLAISWNENIHKTPAQRVFLDIVREHFGKFQKQIDQRTDLK